MAPTVLRVKLGATVAGLAVGLAAAGAMAVGVTAPRLESTSQGTGVPGVGSTRTSPPSTGSATTAVTEDAQPRPTAASGAKEAAAAAVGPDANGPAAFGLCTAWRNHQRAGASGAEPTGSVAFRNLAEAAGGESRIAAFCAAVEHPGSGRRAEAKAKSKSTKAKAEATSRKARPQVRPTKAKAHADASDRKGKPSGG